MLAAQDVRAEDGRAGGAVGGEEQQFQRVAEVEVPDLVAGQAVQGGEVVRGEQGDYRGPGGGAVRQCGAGPGTAEPAALAGIGSRP